MKSFKFFLGGDVKSGVGLSLFGKGRRALVCQRQQPEFIL